MEELRRCPLCGSNRVVIKEENYKGTTLYMIHCKSCGCALTRDDKRQAITEWNQGGR